MSRIDRREFIAVVASSAGVVLVPAPSLVAAGPLADAITGPERLADWTIDDMFGAYPRYADPIGYGRRRETAPPRDDPFEALGFA